MEIWDLYDKNRNLTNRIIERGDKITPGEYHLVIHFWIYNKFNQVLIQKRNKPPEEFGGIWACTGGSAISGESSTITAIREMKEEMGIDIFEKDLSLLKTLKERDYFLDVFISKWNGSIDEVIIDPEEVLDAKWVSIDELKTMIDDKTFYNYGNEYLESVFAHIKNENMAS